MNSRPRDVKRIFLKKGTCSHTLFFILNRRFGNSMPQEERASDILAGLMAKGHQCGMLWGATLAAGAQSYRVYGANGRSVAAALSAAQDIVASFEKRTGSANCRDLTKSNFHKASGVLKYFLTGKLFFCFGLADSWAPEAILSVEASLARDDKVETLPAVSCATEVARKMGASEKEAIMVAGFAGGIGLSGNACGALGAAVWLKTLAWCRQHPGKTPSIFKPVAANTVKAFTDAVGRNFSCQTICGRNFKTVKEHTEFVKGGGCAAIIEALAKS